MGQVLLKTPVKSIYNLTGASHLEVIIQANGGFQCSANKDDLA